MSTSTEPLAARMRPRTIEEIVGQDHILGPGKLLRRVIEADRLTNVIFYGPPACGKTTIAECIAKATSRNFVRLSGVVSGVADIREICRRAREELGGGAPSSSLTKSTVSTNRNRTCCCLMSRTAR